MKYNENIHRKKQVNIKITIILVYTHVCNSLEPILPDTSIAVTPDVAGTSLAVLLDELSDRLSSKRPTFKVKFHADKL